MQNRSLFPKILDEKVFPADFSAETEFFTQNYSEEMNLHYHNCPEIGYCISGSGVEYIGDKLYSFYPGSIAVIQKGCIHDSHIMTDEPVEKPSEWKYIFADIEALGIKADINCSFIFSNHELSLIFNMMFNELEKKEDTYKPVFKNLLEAFILKANRIVPDYYPKGISIPESILPAVNFITNNYAHDISVTEIAEKCSISVSHFRKLFGEYMKCSPLEYLNGVRLSVADRLLKTTDLPITEIAGMAGFASLSSFNRQFKSRYNISPSQVRKDRQKLR